MSVDLWIDRVAQHAKVIVVRLLGGLDWWRYGVDRLSASRANAASRSRCCPARIATTRASPRPRRCRPKSSPRCCVISAKAAARTCARCCAGSRAMLVRAGLTRPRRSRCRACGAYIPADGAVDLERLVGATRCRRGRWCRSSSTARCCSPPTPRRSMRLCEALDARGLAPAPLFVTEPQGAGARPIFMRAALARLAPAVIVTTTAFAAGGEPGEPTRSTGPACRCCRPSRDHQARGVAATSARGLGAADLAMHVVLAGARRARARRRDRPSRMRCPRCDGLAFTAFVNRPEPDRVDVRR